MHLAASLLVAAAIAPAAVHYRVEGDQVGAWPRILESAGFVGAAKAGLVVLAGDAADHPKAATELAEDGATVILIGDSLASRTLGIQPSGPPIAMRAVIDTHNPKLDIVWQEAVNMPPFRVPDGAQVFARERVSQSPVMAGLVCGAGRVLWLAASPGLKGYERFPYLPQALADLGIRSPIRSRNLWAFADSSYRLRADPDYFAQRWRASGIAALHLAAWHFWEPDAQRDAWLERLIEACHKRSILVYAWLELPHVSEAFWRAHPEWREKTALQQDAHLDWRFLMNLQNKECRQAVSAGLQGLVKRFDWDGVNLAELYFESLEGTGNAARFTPMNADVVSRFQAEFQFNPFELFDPASNRHPSKESDSLRTFLTYRAQLAHQLQLDWIEEVEKTRNSKPNLDVVLTHVDDQFDQRMRDSIGADAARILPVLDNRNITFLIEDPATIWDLGPERYTEMAAKYRPLTKKAERLAIDINIVERYQDVYPTKQQTGVELFQLVHTAARAFSRVALYFESSLLAPDLPILPAAAAALTGYEQAGGKLTVESPGGAGIPWKGPALVNDQLWPYQDDATLWLPAGVNTIRPADTQPPVRVLDTSAQIRAATALPNGFEIAYASAATAFFRLDRAVVAFVDGMPEKDGPSTFLRLPRGEHLLHIRVEPRPATE